MPKYGGENPYQLLLKQGLEKAGYTVEYGSQYRFLNLLLTYYKQKPDWIHLDWIYFAYSVNLPTIFKWFFFYIFQFQLWYLKKYTKCKLGYSLHNIERHEYYHQEIDDLAHGLVLKNANFIRVFNSNSIQVIARRWPKVKLEKFYYVPEGSYVGYYPNNINKKDARKNLNLELSDFVILFLGSIRSYKGVIELIKLVGEIKESNWKLLIVGYPYDKGYCEKIKKLIKDKKYAQLILGHQEDGSLQTYFNAADVVALPFKNIENSGSTILAMGFSKPILAPALGVLNERLIQQKEFLYQNSIEESFKALKGKTERELIEIGEQNYLAVQKYKWEDFASLFK
jgi:beta-1,4-mannosyltransferase